MATIEEAIYALLTADAGVGQLLSTRIYPQAIPQDAVLPAVAYQRISGPRILAHDGPTGMARARIQVTVQGSMYADAKEAAHMVRQALDGYSGSVTVGNDTVVIEEINLANEIDGYEFETAGEVSRLDFTALYYGESVWEEVTVPSGWTWTLPFTIERTGNSFRPKNWLISSLKPSGKAYYVKKTGSDLDTGADWAHALATVYTALAKTDAVEIHIDEGRYGYSECAGMPGAYARVFIGYGDVYLTNDMFPTGWTPYGSNSYQVAYTATVGSVWDGATLDAYGDFTQYTLKASAAEVDAAAGSYWLDDPNNILYVRCLDNRQPDDDVHVYRGSSTLLNASNLVTYYFENITFEGGSNRSARFYDAAGTGGLKVYMKDVAIKYNTSVYNALQLDTVELAILEDVTIAKSLKDGINYTQIAVFPPKAIEIDCVVRNCGAAGDNTMNCSTSHLGSTIVRIMGEYHRSYGPCIADVNGAMAWCLGTEAHHNLNAGGGRAGFYIDGTMWLDRCYSHDPNPYDVYVEAAGDALYHREFRSTGNYYNGGGSIGTY